MQDAPERMNDSGTCSPTRAKSRQACSGFGLENLSSQLTRLRNKFGASTPVGYRCSNLMEMFDSLPPAPEDSIEYLTPNWVQPQRENLLKSIRRTATQLAALVGNPQ